MRPMRRALCASVCLALAVGGCTDWDAGPSPSPGVLGVVRSDAGPVPSTGVVGVDGWQAPSYDAVRAGPDAVAGLDATQTFDVPIVQADVASGGGGGNADVAVPDVVADAGPADTIEPDGAPDVVADAGPADVGAPDAAPDVFVDAGPVDAGAPDVAPDVIVDAGPTDADPADAIAPDMAPDATIDAGSGQPDAGWDPDWSGYPDASWPGDVDVYGGVITSCFNAYAYVFTESCVGAALTDACVDQAAADASVYTQFLFQPLRECAKQNCVAGCAAAGENSPKCMEQCLGKQCAHPFFACLAQGETGSNDCPSTFACLGQYEDKIFSIANKCFANATSDAQKQLATFFGCGQEPKTESCFEPIAACYGSGELDCVETVKCTSACKEGDDVCGFECLGNATPKAQQKLDTLWDCIYQKCSDCSGPFGCGETCHTKLCQQEQLACILDP